MKAPCRPEITTSPLDDGERCSALNFSNVAFSGRSWSRFLHPRSMTHSQLLVDFAAEVELQMALMHSNQAYISQSLLFCNPNIQTSPTSSSRLKTPVDSEQLVSVVIIKYDFHTMMSLSLASPGGILWSVAPKNGN